MSRSPSISIALIGAQKAGTSSLKSYLSQHPTVSTHLSLEFAHFSSQPSQRTSFDRVLQHEFPDYRPGKALLIKHAGYYDRPLALQALARHSPDYQVVFLLREPIDRLISAYKMERLKSPDWCPSDFNTAVKEGLASNKAGQPNAFFQIMIRMGHYGQALRHIQQSFRMANVHLFRQTLLRHDAEGVCRQILAAAQITSQDFIIRENSHQNVAQAPRNQKVQKLLAWLRREQNPLKKWSKRALPYSTFLTLSERLVQLNQRSLSPDEQQFDVAPDTLGALAQHYAAEVAELAKLSGQDFSDWQQLYSQYRQAQPR